MDRQAASVLEERPSSIEDEVMGAIRECNASGGYLILRTPSGQKIVRFGDAPPCALLSAL